ncbi:ribosomal-protein-alanine N-acetyltransferase [Agrococcus baldri]|uniref:Ribosomal-protein-alanine N-acetyltransferase n=1 Tax=Agrococcus baldri TaxID=153730 RepID=A0AA94KYU2_9MICO|nr:ribosomal protein S18-alanine N-acetyltransferase [Agrococcus baldri]SFS02478.1 ribosomal-protein-alanine N-acetyltransferase [Agrococcus baldri]
MPGQESGVPEDAMTQHADQSPPATFRIRTATASDLDAIMAIERASFGASAWEAETMRAEIGSEWGRYIVAEEIATDGFAGERTAAESAVAEGADAADSHRALGYAGLRSVGVEGDVQTIAVVEEARGRGIGRALLAELLIEAERRGVRELFLEVRADNPVARALYESVGFGEIGVRPRYYQPEDVDAVVMKKEMLR